MHGIEFSPITDDVKKKEKTAPMIKISWQRYHLAVDEKNCLSSFTVTSTRALSKRENLDNCEPRWRGTGVAIAGSHTNNRGFMMGARYFAPFSSRIASPRLLSLSLSFHSLVSLPRVSREISWPARACESNNYDSTIVVSNHAFLVFINFIGR